MNFEKNGDSPLSEEELSIETEDIEYYQYASHAMKSISEEYSKGIVPKGGTVMWY